MKTLYLIVPLAPLLGAIIAGFWGRSSSATACRAPARTG
jgi:hypothetical protein